MKTLLIWLVPVTLMLGTLASPAMAEISILVDEIHGRPLSEELAEALPMCDITALTPADFPITHVITTGIITEMMTEIFFNVPNDSETLYLEFNFSHSDLQLPFITLFGPNNSHLCSHCEGSMHIEAPQPGQYRLNYSAWEPVSTEYRIGTGPTLLTSELLNDHDIVCNLWNDTMLMFRGELPPYSTTDEIAYLQYLEDGGGFLYLREPLIEMALKPVINIYSDTDVIFNLDLGFPGLLTYAEPPCVTESAPAGTWFRWHDLRVTAEQPQQILYEGKLRRQTNWLQLNAQGDQPSVNNRTDQPLLDLNLIRHEGGDNWRLVKVGTMGPGTEIATTSGEQLNGSQLKAFLENTIRKGGRQAGLYETEIEEFLAHYHWADRWLVDAVTDGQWCGLYRLGAPAYDAHIPFQGEPAAHELVRTMWIWATGLGEYFDGDAPIGSEWALATPTIGATAPIIYHEYGVQYQRGSFTDDAGAKDFSFLGWDYYDGGAVLDETNNCGYPECPQFTLSGSHPDADVFMNDVLVVQGHNSGTLTAPWYEQVLVGDDDAYTEDWVYPPGSYPPLVAAKSVGSGRAATIHDLNILEDQEDNRRFLNNVAIWLTNPVSDSPDVPTLLSHIDALTPNPFNPQLKISFTVSRRQPVVITVCDLAGKRLVTLVDEVCSGGKHAITWDGKDSVGRNLPSGAYLIHLDAVDNDQTRRAMLVR